MMKKHHFSTAGKLCLATMLLLLYAGIPPAQAQSPTPDSLTRYKWEIANDLIWMLGERQGSRFSVLVRKNIATQNGKYRAWRFRVGGNYVLRETNIDGVNETGLLITENVQNRFLVFFMRYGYEWQKQFGKFQINYGLEGELRLGNDKQNDKRTEEADLTTLFSDSETILNSTSIGLVGFLGAKYFISPRWMVSTELNIIAEYKRGYTSDRSFNRRVDIDPAFNSETTSQGESIMNEFRTLLNPVAFAQISYFF